MRRAFQPVSGTDATPTGPTWPKHEVVEASGLSDKTFDRIRKVARVRGPSHGGRNHLFTADDLRALIHAADGGRFTERGPDAAAGWRNLLREAGETVPQTGSRPRTRR